jgi:hypothetical protein
MTYQNDPKNDLNRPTSTRPVEPRNPLQNEGWGTGSIILASLAAMAIVFGLFYAMSNRGDTSMANRNDNRPAVTTTAPATNPPATRETTGSGATTLPANPNATIPQKDPGQPNR